MFVACGKICTQMHQKYGREYIEGLFDYTMVYAKVEYLFLCL